MPEPARLSLVIPAYNEALNLQPTALEAQRGLASQGIEHELILVDDGSSDETWAVMQKLQTSLANVQIVKHPQNRGLGAAVWSGMMAATGNWSTWLPADGQVDIESILSMVQKIAIDPHTDIVLLMREEGQRGWLRRFLTLGLYGWMRMMFGFNPYGYSGIYLARQEILMNMKLHGSTAAQNYAVAIYCQKNGYHLGLAHTAIKPRRSGRSKVANLRTTLITLGDILKLRLTI